MISFYKYHGAGNDFILLDQREQAIDWPTETLQAWCQQHTGIGADGVMYLRSHPHYDFEMLYFNSNGKPGSMCGNGGRCIVAFAHDRGIHKQSYSFLAPDGLHHAHILAAADKPSKVISLQMADVSNIKQEDTQEFFTDTGSPHLVKFVEDVTKVDVQKEGSQIRYQQRFAPHGTNVCFVQQLTPHCLRVRTYERGVEAETLACGTGAVACALVSIHLHDKPQHSIEIHYPGGVLTVKGNKKKYF